MLHQPDSIGSTSYVGIYGIMKAIQVIAKYGVEKHMPWFEQHILGGEGGEGRGEGDETGEEGGAAKRGE
jgi:hypothetical protein